MKRKKPMPAGPDTASKGEASTMDEGCMADDDSDSRAGQAAPRSDAHLSCPACLTTLCVDCQR